MTLEAIKELRNETLGFDPENEQECLEAIKEDGYALHYTLCKRTNS